MTLSREIGDIDSADERNGHVRCLACNPLAAATVAKRVHVAKCIFSRARRWKLVPENPFEHLRAGPQSNPDRAFYVRPEVAQRIIDQCPCPQWRAIIALSRFAGLRCPSKIVELRWGDINWERSLMTVRSPKTAAHDGHAVRIVPMTPELRPILQALFDQAPEGSEAVVPRLTDPTTNLRTTFMKLIARAGYEPRLQAFATSLPQHARQLRHRLGRGPARPRGRQNESTVARPQPAGRGEALPADAGRALRGGDQGWGAGGQRGPSGRDGSRLG